MKKMTSLWKTLYFLVVLPAASAQFSCTLTASDENACLATTADDNKHCVWCAVSSFGFCVSESQAESMEANIPGVQCDRYSPASDDDETPSPDDDAVSNDDAAPAPNDDSLPDDYWTCLKKKDSKECVAEGCTWCDSKGGFGLCLTGPSADMASDSDWFTCSKELPSFQLRGKTTTTKDPYDPSCLAAFLQDPSPDGCTAAMDSEGQPCEFCSFQDSIDLCLTHEQAEMGQQIGMTCKDATERNVQDPYDPSCALAYLQDQSEESCKSAVDADGNPCEYCTLQGAMNFCLNDEQAQMAEQLGAECDGRAEEYEEELILALQDPYDPSCALAFLQDQSKEACESAVDADGNPCEYCTLQGALNLCLNEEQAQAGEALGIECESTAEIATTVSKVGFPSDLWDCLQNYDEDGCASSSCTWCNTEVGIGFCMADAAADAMRECNFFDCNYKEEDSYDVGMEPEQPLDPACLAGMESEVACNATQDSEGMTCVWCDAAGVFGLCLSAEGANAASDYLTCGETMAATKVW